MRTLHFYLLRQVVAALVMTVAVFTFVLLLGNVLKEILALLVNRQASLGMVMQVILLLIPYVMVFSLPMGFLTATLLVFGRMSADQELTAIRASGVSLTALVTPVLWLSIACSAMSALINFQIAPQCRLQYKALLREVGYQRIYQFLPEKTYIRDFTGFIVYIDRVDGTNLHDLQIYTLARDGTLDSYVRAGSGQVHVDLKNGIIELVMVESWRVNMWKGNRTPGYAERLPLTVNLAGQPTRKESISEMTLGRLFTELRDLRATLGTAPSGSGPRSPPGVAEGRGRKPVRPEDLTAPILVQIHRQFSFSFACIGFTLVGIPLGIRAHRRETTFGIVVALLLVFLYYGFFIIGQSLESRPEWAPHLILWLPNILFQAVGGVLFWRANQGV